MPRATLALLLLCACVARPADDAGDDGPTDSTTGDASGSDGTLPPATTDATLDDSSGPSTATVSTSTTGEPLPVSFEGDIQPIFDEHCVAECHEPGGQWGFLLDLSPGTAYAAIVGVTSPQFQPFSMIEPGDPGRSYLWHKVNGTHVDVGGSGLMMPLPRPGMKATVLLPEQLAALEQWILQGAPP